MLDELAGMPLATTSRAGTQVDEVPGVELAVAKGGLHGVVEEGEELVEEAALAFSGETVVETPETRAADGEVVVHVLAGRHPVRVSISVNGVSDVSSTYQSATASKSPTVVTRPLRM